jgi:hypothetical protein
VLVVPRRVGGANLNGHNAISWPGVYLHVLEQVCREQVADPYVGLTDRDLAEGELEQAVEVAALMAQREGEPVHALSYHLPDGMPPLFRQWPVRSIVVTVDDRVTLQLQHNGKAIR